MQKYKKKKKGKFFFFLKLLNLSARHTCVKNPFLGNACCEPEEVSSLSSYAKVMTGC